MAVKQDKIVTLVIPLHEEVLLAFSATGEIPVVLFSPYPCGITSGLRLLYQCRLGFKWAWMTHNGHIFSRLKALKLFHLIFWSSSYNWYFNLSSPQKSLFPGEMISRPFSGHTRQSCVVPSGFFHSDALLCVLVPPLYHVSLGILNHSLLVPCRGIKKIKYNNVHSFIFHFTMADT